jgi:transcriptional regulator with XRE-family HTH domain
VQLPRLKEWREFRGYTQPELAERAGLSLRTVFNYEHGGNALPNNARKLAEALGVQIGDLLSEEAHPKGAAPPSVQLTLNGVLVEERRRPTDSEIKALDRWLSHLERRLDEHNLTRAEIAHEADAFGAFGIRKDPDVYPDALFNRLMRTMRRMLEEGKSIDALQAEFAGLEEEMNRLVEAHEQAQERQ